MSIKEKEGVFRKGSAKNGIQWSCKVKKEGEKDKGVGRKKFPY